MARIGSFGVVVGVLFGLTACASARVPEGTLQVDGQPGHGVSVSEVPNSTDGRAVAMTMSNMSNTSESDGLTLVSARLVDPVDLELVDTFTNSLDAQTGVGQPVPPGLKDSDGNMMHAREEIENWKSRAPLSGYDLAPGADRELALVVRPTLAQSCVWAKGFSVSYQQFGRTYTVTSNAAMIVYSGKTNSCQHVEDDLMEHPIQD